MLPLTRSWKCSSWSGSGPAPDATSTPDTGVAICHVTIAGGAIVATLRVAISDGSPECAAALAVPAPMAKVTVSKVNVNQLNFDQVNSKMDAIDAIATDAVAHATVGASFVEFIFGRRILFGRCIIEATIVVVPHWLWRNLSELCPEFRA
jgi:hypothetical protein